jgi:hypothetical protein
VADMTRANMIDKVLQRLGVLAAGQSANANDAALVGDALDSNHAQYRKRRLAPFATSAFPDWAQEPFAKIISAEVAPYFGIRGLGNEKLDGESDLYEQLESRRNYRPARFKAF